MKTLFIVGNGFDLAHGLPTRYSDFIMHHLCMMRDKVNSYDLDGNKNMTYDDDLFRFQKRIALYELEDFKNPEDFASIWNNIKTGSTRHFIFTNKNRILNAIFKNITHKNWSDFEFLYYELLKEEIRQKNSADNLNKDLEILINNFENYLSSIISDKPDFNKKRNPNIASILENTDKGSCILDFNYTSLIPTFYPRCLENCIHIPIHGQVGNAENPIIMGYGDDYHDDYNSWLSLNESDKLKFLKSYWYFRTPHYRRLIQWIRETNHLNIGILGHSCGLSDRTLLRELFQLDSCKQIKIYYYQSISNYTDITYNISRHFEKAIDVRDKVLDFDQNLRIPQWNDWDENVVDISNQNVYN